jgi:hypothetical protein
MEGLVSWVALFGAGGTIIALITFWLNRGRAEVEGLAEAKLAREEAKGAHSVATTALAKVELLTAQLNEARLEFAREYVNHKDLAASETRLATAIDGLKTEFRGLNERLDRMLEYMISHGTESCANFKTRP